MKMKMETKMEIMTITEMTLIPKNRRTKSRL